MPRVFVAVGANLNPADNVRRALALLGRKVRVLAVSTFYRTEAEGRPDDPPFYNGVVEIDTDLPPAAVKHSLLRPIEAQLGRQRTEDRYAARPIDLDLLLYDDLVLSSDDLAVPDPQIVSRAFLAIPLCEIAPNLLLPDSGRPIAEVAQALQKHTMEPLVEYTQLLRREVQHGPQEG